MTHRAAAWVVFRKEIVDALRDRRTLLAVLLSSVAVGPLVLALVAGLVAGIERRAEAREVVVHGIEHAPSLRNYFERQTYTVRAAPADYERALKDSKLGDPVVVVAAGFEQELSRAEMPVVEVLASSTNQRAVASLGRIVRLLRGFNHEQATLRLAVRGVAPGALESVRIEERDLAEPSARAAQLTTMVPFFVLMAVLYGALNAALDTTAGERERGSLEPLLMNPASRAALVAGKWAAVAAVGMLIALLSCLSFLPAQWLLASDTLAALFQFGWREAAWFIALLAPLAGALAALLMAIAIRCRTFKEAQANATIVVLAVSLLPLLLVFNQEGESPWHLWLPGLAQITLMTRVLKGAAVAPGEIALALAACVVVAAAGIALVARALRGEALK